MTKCKKMPAKSEELAGEFAKWLTRRRPTYSVIETLEDGTVVGSVGAYRWILDNEGYPLSNAFLDIVPAGKGYTGRIGSSAFRLKKDGELYSRDSQRYGPHANDNVSAYKLLFGVQSLKDERFLRTL